MIQPEPITWLNSVLPMGIIAGMAVVVPWMLLRKGTRSQWEVVVTIWASAGVMLIVSGVVYAALYAVRGHAVGEAFGEAPVMTLWFFIKLAGYAAVLWVPILALVWFGMAQGVERRRGEDAARH
ncbi:MAG: hypothetical protein AAFO72_10675 [Pseudomonadota bacterium]